MTGLSSSVTAAPAGSLSSVCINGHAVYGKFAQESQAIATALALKSKLKSAIVTVRDENSGVHFCVAAPRNQV